MHSSRRSPAIPLIDIAPAVAGGAAERAVDAVREACGRIGFFLVTGHGVPEPKIRRLHDRALAFFGRPDAVKRGLPQGAAQQGGAMFAPVEDEALAATRGVATPGDFKESLNYGPRLMGAPWPDDPAGLRQAFEAYFLEMERLAHCLRRIFCRALGLAETYFEPSFTDHLSALRVIHYPEQATAPRPGQLRAGAHSDYGFLTILWSDAARGGLQVRTRAGEWIDAPVVPGAFVVNIGDALMRWTNDGWVSTLHRVANPPKTGISSRRVSIPFFLNPNEDTVIRCLELFAGRGAGYEPVTYRDYIQLKTRQAFGA
ncbi:MAG: oxidoreductase [Proteobacteria bacterium]|nr:oxidoreductase [Pseudomonadota bacterium]MBI3498671.1 oxidoreductase [Pseudomonadota bacterium]